MSLGEKLGDLPSGPVIAIVILALAAGVVWAIESSPVSGSKPPKEQDLSVLNHHRYVLDGYNVNEWTTIHGLRCVQTSGTIFCVGEKAP